MDIQYSEISKDILEWFATKGLSIGVILLVVEVSSKFMRMIVGRLINSALRSKQFPTKQDRKRRAETLTGMTSAALRIVIWIIGILLIISELGVDIRAVAAGAGVIGLALGFGAQSLIKDFTTGFFIILENQYRVGDVVSINGVNGTVQAITVRTTVLRDLDGNVHHIPNGEIKLSTNKTIGFSRLNIDIGVSYDSNIEKVEKVINDVGVHLATDKDWAEFIVDPPLFKRVDDFGPSAVVIKVLGKVKPGEQWKVAGEFRRRILKAFEKNKIEIPKVQVVTSENKQ